MSTKSSPVTTSSSAGWVATLFLLGVLLQRFSVPGLTAVPLLLPVVFGWMVLGLRRRVVEIDPTRFAFWGIAAVVTGLMMLLQAAFSFYAVISAASWALIFTVSLPFVLRLTDRSEVAYREVLRRVSNYGVVLGGAAAVMSVVQLLGVPYRDYLGDAVPTSFLLDGYVISYPYVYGSPLYRSNAFIGLEPSFVSFQIGLALLAAALLGRRVWMFAILLAGLISTASGSGMLLVATGLVVLALWPRRRVLVRYLIPTAVGLVVLISTPFGQGLLGRTGEGDDPQSSTSLRVITPYQTLYPPWSTDPVAGLVGRGAGSSQRIVAQSGVVGLLVPTPAKIFFDYGLIAGAVLTAFAVFCYLGGPSRAIATALFVSLWSIQPGLTTMLLTMNVVAFVSLWSPGRKSSLEADPGFTARVRARPPAPPPPVPRATATHSGPSAVPLVDAGSAALEGPTR